MERPHHTHSLPDLGNSPHNTTIATALSNIPLTCPQPKHSKYIYPSSFFYLLRKTNLKLNTKQTLPIYHMLSCPYSIIFIYLGDQNREKSKITYATTKQAHALHAPTSPLLIFSFFVGVMIWCIYCIVELFVHDTKTIQQMYVLNYVMMLYMDDGPHI